MFPEKLPHRLIKMFAFRGDTVLDPFMGSGTTSLAAKNLGRNSVGYDINPEFIEIAKQKLNTGQPDFMGTEYEFLHDTVKEILSPEKVRLSNGLTVKLIGIKSEPFTHDKAIGDLTEKIKGKRIILKYDKLKHDSYSLRMSLRFLPILSAHLS